MKLLVATHHRIDNGLFHTYIHTHTHIHATPTRPQSDRRGHALSRPHTRATQAVVLLKVDGYTHAPVLPTRRTGPAANTYVACVAWKAFRSTPTEPRYVCGTRAAIATQSMVRFPTCLHAKQHAEHLSARTTQATGPAHRTTAHAHNQHHRARTRPHTHLAILTRGRDTSRATTPPPPVRCKKMVSLVEEAGNQQVPSRVARTTMHWAEHAAPAL